MSTIKGVPLKNQHTPLLETFTSPGAYLRHVRKLRKFTAREVALHLGINRNGGDAQYVYAFERDKIKLQLKHVKDLCRLYGLKDAEIRRMYMEREIKDVKHKWGFEF